MNASSGNARWSCMYSWSCPEPNGPSPDGEYTHPIHAYSLLNATGECGSAFVSQ